MQDNKDNTSQVLTKRIASIEDLFETQRRELFSSLSELERVMQKKYDRAIKEVCGELKINNPLL
jgi:hypothetical protein